jgi:hypothetical protein
VIKTDHRYRRAPQRTGYNERQNVRTANLDHVRLEITDDATDGRSRNDQPIPGSADPDGWDMKQAGASLVDPFVSVGRHDKTVGDVTIAIVRSFPVVVDPDATADGRIEIVYVTDPHAVAAASRSVAQNRLRPVVPFLNQVHKRLPYSFTIPSVCTEHVAVEEGTGLFGATIRIVER